MRINPTVSRPLPRLGDEYTRTYFGEWAAGRLVVQHCPECGHWQHYPRALCEKCGATPVFEEQEPAGVVWTYTIIRQMGTEPFRSEAPYPVAMIALAGGIKIMGTITDCEPEQVRIGMRVRGYPVVYGEIGLPFWRPDTSDQPVAGEDGSHG
ncbi:nucleic acid-binding protein [Nakamurella sp. YIM 132087]|uniref:Nucleic acid-binding protein n=1 Tax=Nakamurella alba TaxID=2665158 RepID=A0A7K1FEA4_9ACTN|nr:Zn-ribbon domain-containing OB-fold protein [Nakamurella alba]MTD12428.1 nucleic acid-binding protein [Nakamurella alba]